MHASTVFLTFLPLLALAKTDIGGCTSSATTNEFGEASMIYWVPDTHEICEFLDCGGGRAPPKYSVPGCAAYTGTESYQPEYMPGWGPEGQIAEATPTPEAASAAESVAAGATSALEESFTVHIPIPVSSGASEVLTGASALITEAPTLPLTQITGTNTPAAVSGGSSSGSAPAAQSTGAAAGMSVGASFGVLAGAIAGLAAL